MDSLENENIEVCEEEIIPVYSSNSRIRVRLLAELFYVKSG